MQPPLFLTGKIHPVPGMLARHASEARLRVHFHSAGPFSEAGEEEELFSRAATLSSGARTTAPTDHREPWHKQETTNAGQSGSGFLFQRVSSIPRDFTFS